MKILLLDNYDSFTFNLLHILEQVEGLETNVIRNDEIDPLKTEEFDGILLSPGPGLPSEAGLMNKLIQVNAGKKKILGICLGHQAIGEAFGAKLNNLSSVRHGTGLQTIITDATDPLFQNIPSPFITGRYHSWVIDPSSITDKIRVIATDNESNIMAIRHVDLPIWGVQFHPESILTEYGKELIINWLRC